MNPETSLVAQWLILPSSTVDESSIPGQGANTLHASGPKKQNIKQGNIVINSIKTLKMVHLKKLIKKHMNPDS